MQILFLVDFFNPAATAPGKPPKLVTFDPDLKERGRGREREREREGERENCFTRIVV